MGKEKVNMKMVVIGHKQSGKSTTAGHLIQKLGGVSKTEMERLEKKAGEMEKMGGTTSSKYAWVMYKLICERERGMSIELSMKKVETDKYQLTVMDAPGHRDFIRNMLTATSQADSALLVVDSTSGGFEIGMSRGGQTREHGLLAFALGVTQIICCCNKMDATTPKYSKARFEEIVNQVSSYLKKLGYKPNNIEFIPISGSKGDNLTERSTNLEWHSGPTLLQAIDNLKPAKRSHVDKPLRLPLMDAYKVRGATVAIGRVQSGLLKPGMNITFAPSGRTGRVKTVEIHRQAVIEAGPAGDIVGFSVEGLEVGELARGQVVCDSSRQPAKAVASFIAKIVVVDHEGGIRKGYAPVLDCHAAHVAVKFEELVSRIDRRTGKEVEKGPESLKTGEAGIVKMVPTRPMVVEAFTEYPRLGRFSVRDIGTTVAVGVVLKTVVN